MKFLTLIFLNFLIPQISLGDNVEAIHKYIFVAPNGDDKHNGSIDKPIASFKAAQLLVRNIKKENATIPITVYFRGGKYYQTKSVIFTYLDGGSSTGPIKYMAYPGEIPTILGGKQLNLKWEEFEDGIYKAKVPKGLIFESLFIDDQEQILARYPNYDPDIRTFNGTAADCISKEKVKQWADPTGGYFHVIHKALWGGFHFRITGKDKKGNLTMEGGWQNNRPENGLHDKLRYVENIFEELDAEKEWFLDRQNGILYFKPSKNVDLNTANVEVAYLENFIELRGTEEKPVRHLSFDGFYFNRTIRTFMKTKDRLLRSDWTIYRGGAVYFEGTEYCSIKNCEFYQVGGNAIFVNAYNRHANISACHLYDIGASAICFVGDTSAVRNPKFSAYGPPVEDSELDMTPGPKNNKYPAYCKAENNLIHSIGKVEKQTAGIQISMAMNITISHNSIYDCPRAGINVGEGAWGGHLVEFNDVFNTVLETSDHGSFNSWGRDRYWMANNERTEERVAKYPSSIFWDMPKPTIIRNNRMRCDHGWDIDLDDGSSYYHIYNNLCLKNGIKLREGYYRKVENNICVNNAIHPHVWFKNNSDIIRGNIFGSSFYPIRVDYWGKEIDYNWYMAEADLEKSRSWGIEKNSLAGNPMFVDPGNGDFSVMESSKVYTLGWKNFPMDKFGVQKEELRKIAKKPEISAILYVSETGQKVYDFFGGRIKNLESEGEVSATGMYEKTGVLIVEVPIFGDITDFNLQKGDVVLKVNNIEVKDVDFFLNKKSNSNKRQNIQSVTVWRNQKIKMLD